MGHLQQYYTTFSSFSSDGMDVHPSLIVDTLQTNKNEALLAVGYELD